MNIEFLVLGGYGQFVWPAFIFTFVSCFLLYLKTKKELKKQEKMFLIEFKQIPTRKIEVAKQKELSKEVLSGSPVYWSLVNYLIHFMLSKKARSRFFVLMFLLLSAAIVVFVVLKSLEENVVYFFSPTEIYNKENISFNKKIRVGGLVKEGSITNNQTSVNFIVTDLNNEIIVSYSGSLPNLFSEGKGVVAEGKLKDKKYFIADKILAKHDENYMPPEVSKALEKAKN